MLRALNPGAILVDRYEEGLLGWAHTQHSTVVAVYDMRRCVEVRVLRDGLTEEQAEAELRDCASLGGDCDPLFVESTGALY